jgi:hypothetical protein
MKIISTIAIAGLEAVYDRRARDQSAVIDRL